MEAWDNLRRTFTGHGLCIIERYGARGDDCRSNAIESGTASPEGSSGGKRECVEISPSNSASTD